jgi:DICT domain-containing protein
LPNRESSEFLSKPPSKRPTQAVEQRVLGIWYIDIGLSSKKAVYAGMFHLH